MMASGSGSEFSTVTQQNIVFPPILSPDAGKPDENGFSLQNPGGIGDAGQIGPAAKRFDSSEKVIPFSAAGSGCEFSIP